MTQENKQLELDLGIERQEDNTPDYPTGGYIPSESDRQRDIRNEEILRQTHPEMFSEEQQQGEVSGNQDLAELSEKLGVNPEDIGKPPVEEPQYQQDPDDWYSKQFEAEEARQFAENFKKHLGIDIKEVYGLIKQTSEVTQHVDNWRKEAYAQQQLEKLKGEFGEEFDTLLPKVKQKFEEIKKVNPRQAEQLDNYDGALMLAALIRQEGSTGYSTPTPSGENVPQYMPNRRSINHGQPTSPTIRMSEFISWTDKEVDERYGEILAAKQNGTFIYDI